MCKSVLSNNFPTLYYILTLILISCFPKSSVNIYILKLYIYKLLLAIIYLIFRQYKFSTTYKKIPKIEFKGVLISFQKKREIKKRIYVCVFSPTVDSLRSVHLHLVRKLPFKKNQTINDKISNQALHSKMHYSLGQSIANGHSIRTRETKSGFKLSIT